MADEKRPGFFATAPGTQEREAEERIAAAHGLVLKEMKPIEGLRGFVAVDAVPRTLDECAGSVSAESHKAEGLQVWLAARVGASVEIWRDRTVDPDNDRQGWCCGVSTPDRDFSCGPQATIDDAIAAACRGFEQLEKGEVPA